LQTPITQKENRQNHKSLCISWLGCKDEEGCLPQLH
jgi:hypothetical protein